MESIWNNTFYNNHPALGWVYKLNLSKYASGAFYDKIKTLEQAVVDVQVGKRESEYTSVFYGGLEFKKFTRANNTNNFTIKFNEDKKYTITSILEDLYNRDNLNQAYPIEENTAYNSPLFNGINDPKGRIIKVLMFDPNILSTQVLDGENATASIEFAFHDCHIVSLDDLTLSYESTESITRSATFVYSFMEFIRNDQINTKTDANVAANNITSENQNNQSDDTIIRPGMIDGQAQAARQSGAARLGRYR